MKEKMTEDQIRSCEITYEGNKYSPVKHGVIIDIIKDHLDQQGFVIEKEEYLTAKDGQQLIGKYMLSWNDDEIKPMISFKNSLDGSMAFGICSGTSVAICSNGCVYGDAYQYKRKHTGEAHEEILENIRIACEAIPAVMAYHKQLIFDLKNRWMDLTEAARICGSLFFDGIITSTQLNTIKDEFENPTHDYGHPNTAWEFYNHCTFAMKDTHPLKWHKLHKQLSDFFQQILDNNYTDEEE